MVANALIAFVMIFLIGGLSLIGIFFISLKEKTLERILFVLIAFATGTILASALFDLIPESLHHMEELNSEGADIDEVLPFIFVMIGYLVFFILERFIYWFHGHAHQEEEEFVCHGNISTDMENKEKGTPKIKNFAILNLIGDGLHNFLDGVVIMVAFISDITVGIAVTLAVIFHELPQEIGDFGILIYGGFTKKKAMLFNFLSAMIAMLGGLFAYLLADTVETFSFFILAFSGGGFLYIATSELMPELLKERDLKKSIIQTLILLVGIGMIYGLMQVLPHV
jgi:zinc and cadmium transporter